MSYNSNFTLSFLSSCLPFSPFSWQSELHGVLLSSFLLFLVERNVCRLLRPEHVLFILWSKNTTPYCGLIMDSEIELGNVGSQ